MSHIFVSYSREDQPRARQFAESLERAGFNVWWDQALKPGEAFDQVTERALDEAAAVVVLWSKASVQSRWVRAEATQANAAGKLVPVMIEECRRPIMFELTHTVDLAAWKGSVQDPAWKSFEAGLRRFAGGANDAPRTPSVTVASRAGRTRRIGIVAGAIALLALLATGYRWMAHVGAATTTGQSGITLAVVPFKDISPDHDQQTFVDGLTVEVRNALTRLSGLLVIGRTSSDVYKNVDVDLRQIGKDLAVANVVEGDVRRVGDKVRIGVHLTNAATGATLWGDDYELPMAEIQKTPEVIARKVAETLQIKLGVGEIGSQPGMTRKPEAYAAYLEGLAENDAVLNVESLQRAIAKFELATELDPEFAQAWFNLQNYYNFAQTFDTRLTSPEEFARKADAAMARFRRLLPDDPIFSADPSGIPMFLTSAGRLREAVPLWERERTRDPLNSFVAAMLSQAYAGTGSLEAARAEIARGHRLGQPDALLEMSSVMVEMAGTDRGALLASVRSMTGRNYVGLEVLRAVEPLLDEPKQALAALRKVQVTGANAITIAEWMAWFGAPEESLKLLTDHVAEINSARRIPLWGIWHPVMAQVRRLPGFKDLMRTLTMKDVQLGWTMVDAWQRTKWGDFCKPTQDGKDFECH